MPVAPVPITATRFPLTSTLEIDQRWFYRVNEGYKPVGRPERGMIHILELLKTRPVGKMSLGREPECGDQVPAGSSATILGLDSPLLRLVAVLRINHSALEGDIFANVEFLVNVIEVFPKFLPTRVFFGPVPILACI